MPPINHAVLAPVGIAVAAVTVAAAIAIYEIPEVRRAAQDLRRRIAIALHSLGDNVDPAHPRFNRPEDAEGFYESHELDADEETRRRQREELMYWNMLREERLREQAERESRDRPPGQTFEDFLEPDARGPSGTLVYNTGASTRDLDTSGVLRRRGNPEGVRGLNAAVLSNPFGDEYGIEMDERPQLLSPPRDEVEMLSDIYDATPLVQSPRPEHAESVALISPRPLPSTSEVLFEYESHAPSEYGTAMSSTDSDFTQEQQKRPATPDRSTTPTATATPSSRSETVGRDELANDEYMTAGQSDRDAADAYASIQAWARHSSSQSFDNVQYNGAASFYSPLPHTPQAPMSEPELVSEGQLTPTTSDSASVVDVAAAAAAAAQERSNEDDVMSMTDGGAPTPASWSDVGSVVSESESAWRG
ncbi:hypothetical protein VTJ04DRAFT_4658 [Mycothermus thermophilus]|uniref:uncharacterized protein n=1 Tax=Humicola insolens TaxID=85995 RepID=UPI003742CC51